MPTPKAPEAATGTRVPVVGANAAIESFPVKVLVDPTQVRRPWRSTARTVFQALVALAVLFPVLVQTAGLDPDSLPWLAGALAIAGGLARIMAHPLVEEFLRRFVPFLAAAPSADPQGILGKAFATFGRRDQRGHATADLTLGVALGLALLVLTVSIVAAVLTYMIGA